MLIEFRKIEFSNYKAIKNGALSLTNQNVVLIQGINNDKSGSNGAGKSTIANGLLWCLYGKTLIGRETEKEIIPKFISPKKFKASGGCSVTVYLKRDGIEYKISRYRKSPTYKNTAVIQRLENESYEDISKCTDGETDALIVDIVGAGYDAFIHSNIFSFNNIVPFLSCNDAKKKELILPKFFIDMFKDGSKKCGIQIKEVEQNLRCIDEGILACTVKESEKKNNKNDIIRDIKTRNNLLEEAKEKLFLERNSRVILNSELTNLNRKTTELTNILHVLAVKQEGYKIEQEDQSQKSLRLESLCLKKTQIERDVSLEKLKLEGYKQDNKDASVIKFTQLSKTSEEKGKLYVDLDVKIKACRKKLGTHQETLQQILSTKDIIHGKRSSQVQDLEELTEKIAAMLSEKSTLLSQKNDIETKYLSEKCKTCPESKMKEFFKETEKRVTALDKALSTAQAIAAKIQEKRDKFVSNFKEATVLADACRGVIHEIETKELSQLQNKMCVVETALQELKLSLMEVQSKITNANEILNDISTVELSIDSLTKELKKVELGIAKQTIIVKSQVVNFTDLIRDNDAEQKLIKQKQVSVEGVNTKTLVELGALNERVRFLEEASVVTDDLEDKKEKITREIDTVQEEQEALNVQHHQLNERLSVLSFWKTGFGPTGIEGFMLDSLVNTMNSLINKYLGYLTNNTISLTLVPEKTLKTGDVRNKISEKIENDFGGVSYRTNSEGEKRTMDIAVLFALKYIYEQITGTKYNILFLDEAFDTLDASTCSLVINLINTLENIDSIFVVSHIDAIALEFDNFVKMVKTKGVTEIVKEV